MMQQWITFVLIGVKGWVQVTSDNVTSGIRWPTTAAAVSRGVSAGAVGVGVVTEFDAC